MKIYVIHDKRHRTVDTALTEVEAKAIQLRWKKKFKIKLYIRTADI